MKYSEHKKYWDNCEKCYLHKRRTRVVLARGRIPCDILFVGEAPGFSEDVQGIPFIGPAGKLLDTIVSESIPNTLRFLVTNLIGCIPLEQENYTKVETPPIGCVNACSERIQQLVDIAKPKLLVCVGKEAEHYLMNEKHKAYIQLNNCIKYKIEITHPSAILQKPHVHQTLAIRDCVIKIQDAIQKTFH